MCLAICVAKVVLPEPGAPLTTTSKGLCTMICLVYSKIARFLPELFLLCWVFYRPLVEVEPVVPVPVEVELVPVLVVVPVALDPVAFCVALPVLEL